MDALFELDGPDPIKPAQARVSDPAPARDAWAEDLEPAWEPGPEPEPEDEPMPEEAWTPPTEATTAQVQAQPSPATASAARTPELEHSRFPPFLCVVMTSCQQ